jgi:tetratricopeptide (TPR) repeat protein
MYAAWIRQGVPVAGDNSEELIDRIEQHLESGNAAGALDLASFAVRRYPANPDLWALYAEALEGSGRMPEAVEAYTRALALTPEWVAGQARRGSLLLELGEIDRSRQDVEAALAADTSMAEAWFTRGMLAELDGNDVEAARSFRQAEALDPDRYYLPVRVSAERFQEACGQARGELPTRLREYLEGVPVIVRDMPTALPDGSFEHGHNPLTLAYLRGEQPAEGVPDAWSHKPSAVVIFKKNVERFCSEAEDLPQELAVTLYHEALYFLGVSDEEAAEQAEQPGP